MMEHWHYLPKEPTDSPELKRWGFFPLEAICDEKGVRVRACTSFSLLFSEHECVQSVSDFEIVDLIPVIKLQYLEF